MKYTDTRAVVEAGFLTSIVIALDLLSSSVPLLGILGGVVAPMVLAMIAIRHGIRWSILGLITSFVVLLIFLGPLQAGYEAAFSSIGVVLGLGYVKQWKTYKMVLIPSVFSFCLFISAVLATMYILQVDLATMWENAKATAIANGMATYENQGFSEEQLTQIRTLLTEQLNQLYNIFLLAAYFASLIIVYFIAELTEFVARRTGTAVANPMPLVHEWKMPKWSLYILITGVICLYWGNTRDIYLLNQIGINLDTLGTLLLTIQGISFWWFLCERFHISSFFKWLAVLFMVVVSSIGIVLGIFDLFSNYRKSWEQSK